MGKTTLSQLADDRPVIGTDSYQDMAWEEIPHRMIADTANLKAFLVEGVMVARALRKGMAVDAVVYMNIPKVRDRLPGQIAMAKGIAKIFSDWRTANPTVPVFIEVPNNEALSSMYV